MASNTPNLNLLKKDPLTDGNETFNIQTMMNDNWDKIDTAVKKVQDDVASIDPDIPDASTTKKGIVQLTSATNSTSETLAATAKAVKTVADASLPKTGGAISGDISISGKSTLVGPIDFRNGIDGLGDIKTTGNIRANGMVNFTAKLFVGSGDNNAQPGLSLSIGDNDTGFNHNSDGYVDFISNGRTVAYMKGGRFVVRGDGDDFYDVARDIINLKQSGVNLKQQLVDAINANAGSASISEEFSALINKIRLISQTKYKEVNVSTNALGGSENATLSIPSGFYNKVKITFNENNFDNYSEISTAFATVTTRYSSTYGEQNASVYVQDGNGNSVQLGNFVGINNGGSYYIKGITVTPSKVILGYYKSTGSANDSGTLFSINTPSGFNMSSGIIVTLVKNNWRSDSSYPSFSFASSIIAIGG